MSTSAHELKVQTRQEFGKNAARRARKNGMVPAIVYSKGKEGTPLYINSGDWEVAAQHGSSLIYLVEGDKKTAALVKEAQFNVLKNHYVHVDFLEVNLMEEIHAEVPVHAMGEAYGATHGGILEQMLHELHVVCKAKDLPELIQVDVSALNIGDAIHVADLQLPEGVKADEDGEDMVFHCVHEEKEEVAPAPAEGDAAAEPEVANAKGVKDEDKDAAAGKDAKK